MRGKFFKRCHFENSKKKKIKGRSRCPKCKKKLRWYELVPLFNFLFLGGKCLSCKKPISWQYPLVEAFTGISFVFIFCQITEQLTKLDIVTVINALFWFLFLGFLIVIFVSDFKFYIVPDRVIYPAILVAFFYQVFN